MSEYSGKYVLVNITEMIARHLVPKMMESESACNCDLCRMDVLALTLNRFIGNYITLGHDEDANKAANSRISKEHESEITEAIAKAITFVKSKPRHD